MIDRLSLIGIKAAVHLASRSIKVPGNIVVINHDISIVLRMLTYRINQKNQEIKGSNLQYKATEQVLDIRHNR